MSFDAHDPREHIRGFHQILISDKKRIGFLFGAGSSYATNISDVYVPTVAEMTKVIVDTVGESSPNYAKAIQEIRNEIGECTFNIESLLSTIEAKRAVIGAGNLNGLTGDCFKGLADLVKRKVVELVSVHRKLSREDVIGLSHSNLSSWISKARRRYPAEIFTTNYDFLFEMALEAAGEPYFDGFSGSYEPFFCPEAVEDIEAFPSLVKLWKMHGSLGWTYRESDKAVIRSPSSSDQSILIYPSHLKYNTSKKQPYVGLIDRLCNFLQQDDAVLITCGYSFGDSHINERIATSLRRGANSHVIAMYYDEHTDEANNKTYGLTNAANSVREMATHETGGKMSVYGMRHAVIGGKFGEWKLRDEPTLSDLIRVSQYFDEDASLPSDDGGERKGDEVWTGLGAFLLPDFCKLTEFLNDLSSSQIVMGTVGQS
jgi:SIR2-like domain